jgi:hypothetical protein
MARHNDTDFRQFLRETAFSLTKSVTVLLSSCDLHAEKRTVNDVFTIVPLLHFKPHHYHLSLFSNDFVSRISFRFALSHSVFLLLSVFITHLYLANFRSLSLSLLSCAWSPPQRVDDDKTEEEEAKKSHLLQSMVD